MNTGLHCGPSTVVLRHTVLRPPTPMDFAHKAPDELRREHSTETHSSPVTSRKLPPICSRPISSSTNKHPGARAGEGGLALKGFAKLK